MSTASELAAEIIAHARVFERAEATRKVQLLGSAVSGLTYPKADARVLLQALLNVRWFELASVVGALMIANGVTDSGFVRRYAQALVESGQLKKAEDVLRAQLANEPNGERKELFGVLGRALKQRFINRMRSDGVSDPAILIAAMNAYEDGYKLYPEENTWHGINLVACLRYAQRHGIDDARVGAAGDLTNEVLANLQAKNALDAWDIGTRAEAQLASGNIPDAMESLREYVSAPNITAFNLGSTLRQFIEIWELDARSDDAPELLFMLRARLSEIENGSLLLVPKDVRAVRDGSGILQLQKAFGDAKFTSLNWFRTAVQRCGGVAQIGNDTSWRGGTGFLVRGSELAPLLGTEVVLVTNAHVISSSEPGAFAPDEALIRLQASDSVDARTVLRVSDVVYSSPRAELDVTVARVQPPLPADAGLRLAKEPPVVKSGARVLIIGHPDGGDIAFSINDNALLDLDHRYLHYRAPTEGGSSGSPVFNLEWKVIGLHHGGGSALKRLNAKPGTYEANEGIRMDTIAKAVADKLG